MSCKKLSKARVVEPVAAEAVEAAEVMVVKEDGHHVTHAHCIVSHKAKVLVIQLSNIHIL